MPRILLIAATTGYQTRSFAEAARRQGVDCTLATDRCHVLEDPWHDNAIPVRFEEPAESAETLARSLAGCAIDGIVAVADRPTLIAALTAEKLGLDWHPPRAAAACRDKHRMRELFAAAGLRVPANFRVVIDADPHEAARNARYPCVLKPLGLSASRGVIRANNAAEFACAFDRIRRILKEPEIVRLRETWNEAVQVEDYIEGREFALEGLMTQGKLQVLAIFDKPDPLEGPFFEETIYTTPSRDRTVVQDAIENTVKSAVHALGLYHGPIHAEMRAEAGRVTMLEIAARPIGGLCARALRFLGGITLEELVLLHAIGRMPRRLAPAAPASGVMMIPVPCAGIYQSVSGIEEARNTPGIDEVIVTAKPGQQLRPLPEGSSYPGFIFGSGSTAAEVEDSLRLAHSRLKFDITTTLKVVSR